MRRALPLACVLLTACSLGQPLGDDWGQLDEPARDARALATLEDLFAGGVDGGGGKVNDRVVLSCDRTGITYRAADGKTDSSLRWEDVESVENRPHPDLPSRAETLTLYLKQQSSSARTVGDLVRPPLASTGLVSCYVELRSRPRWSRNKLLAALHQIRRAPETPAPPATKDPPQTEPEPGPERPETTPPEAEDPLEAKLRKLKRWHEEGLIDDEEYESKRKALLEGF